MNIKHHHKILTQLQKKYVDDSVADCIKSPASAEVGQIVKIAAVDDAGKPTAWEAVDLPEQVQPDWNQNDDTATDFVKNRPFYSETKNITVENAVNETLKGFPVFSVGDTVTVNVDGVEYSLVAYDDEGCVTIGDTFNSVDNGEGQLGWNIYVDEEVYIYATESHTVSYLGIDHHKIDLKYLPTQRVAFTKSEYNDGALSDTMSDGEVLDSVVLNIPVLKSPFLEGQIACSPDGSLFLRNQYARFGYFVTVTGAIEINSDTLTSETFELSIPDGEIYRLKVCDIYTKTQYYVLFPSMPGGFIHTSVGFIDNSSTQSVAYINGHLFAFCTSSLPIGQDRTITLTVKKIL